MSVQTNCASSTDTKLSGTSTCATPLVIEDLHLFDEVTIPVPWGHIKGKWWGPRDKQPILALHGWQDNAGTFDNLAPLLPDSMSMLCIDLPGHGLSSHYPPGQMYYLFWDGIVVVRRIAQYYKWKKISLLGHSLGGAIGFLYAGTWPDQVENLICIDIACPTVRDPSRIQTETGGSVDRLLKYERLTSADMPCYAYDEMIDLVLDAYQGALTRDSCKVLMKRGMVPIPPNDGNGMPKGYHFCRDVRLKVSGLGFVAIDLVLAYASKITCRYMNIKGNPGMSFDKPEYYTQVLEKIQKSAKEFRFHEIDGTHHVHLNNPERVSPLLISFLKD